MASGELRMKLLKEKILEMGLKEEELHFIGKIISHDPNEKGDKGSRGDVYLFEHFELHEKGIVKRFNKHFIYDGDKWVETVGVRRFFHITDYANCFLHADEYEDEEEDETESWFEKEED